MIKPIDVLLPMMLWVLFIGLVTIAGKLETIIRLLRELQ